MAKKPTVLDLRRRKGGRMVMVTAYDALGMKDLRDDAERVMLKNFPHSKYLKGEVGRKTPWWQLWN